MRSTFASLFSSKFRAPRTDIQLCPRERRMWLEQNQQIATTYKTLQRGRAAGGRAARHAAGAWPASAAVVPVEQRGPPTRGAAGRMEGVSVPGNGQPTGPGAGLRFAATLL